MNKKFKFILALMVLSGTTLYATGNLVGTEQDPLVTKSYVDKKIAEISTNGGGNNSIFASQLEEQEQLILALKEEIASIRENSESTYEIVVVPEGKTIIGKQGTEIIVRAGEARIIASNGGGVQDITDGADLANNVLAPRYNLLLIPREDGRGLLATKKLTVMVRGGFIIQ